jgi:hypothetical protein
MSSPPVHCEDVVAHAVVVRGRGMDVHYPWPHYVGVRSSMEEEPRPAETPDHPPGDGERMRRIRLTANHSFLETGTVVATLCEYSDVAPGRCALWPMARLLDSFERLGPWIVSGGVEVCVAGRPVIGPECCCGLEKWREWQVFLDGGDAPWCGHDPDPIVRRLESGAIELGYEGGPATTLVAPGALRSALEQMERDLQGFLGALSRWADQVMPRLAPAFVAAFAQSMDIRREGA